MKRLTSLQHPQIAKSFWYVVTGDETRHHLDMAIVSAAALRFGIPEASINLACDSSCLQLTKQYQPELARYFDTVRQLDSPHGDPGLRCRDIKIRLRLELTGDFFFLDTDTLVVERFDDLIPGDCPVAMALDSPHGTPGELPGTVQTNFAKNGWNYPVYPYLNSGVILWRDLPRAHALARQWLKDWEQSVSVGIPLDQPALANSNRSLGGVIGILPPELNLPPFVSSPNATRKAKIWHFWGHRIRRGSVFQAMVEDFQNTGIVNLDLFERARRAHHPWVRRGNEGFRKLLRHRRWGMAILEIPRASLRQLGRTLGQNP